MNFALGYLAFGQTYALIMAGLLGLCVLGVVVRLVVEYFQRVRKFGKY